MGNYILCHGILYHYFIMSYITISWYPYNISLLNLSIKMIIIFKALIAYEDAGVEILH